MSELRICMLTPGSMLHDARIQKEAQALCEKGHKVTIVCIEDYKVMKQYGDDSPQWQGYHEAMKGIVTERHILRSRRWRKLPKFINRFFQSSEMGLVFLSAAFRCKADVYHCHDLIPGVFACFAKFIHRGKLVYDAHEMEIEMGGAKGFARQLLKLYESMVVRYSDARITVNDYIREVMEESYGKQVTVIENRPIVPDNLDPKELRRKLNIPDDVFVVMYVGFLSMARGIDKMVTAMKFLPDNVRFYLLGTGRVEEFKRRVAELAEENQVSPSRIVFIDPVQPNEVLNVLCAADASIMLYQKISVNNEINTPNKLFQSVVAKIPIVASSNKSFSSFLKRPEGDLGIVVDESKPELIAAAITELMNPERKQQIESVLAKYSHVYTWEGQKEKLLNLYAGLNK